MMRLLRQRRLWAGLLGTVAAVGLAFAQEDANTPTGPPKVGDVITLKFRDGPDRQFKVMKVDKQPDGSYLSEVKDTKSGETITLVDRPGDFPANPPVAPKETEAPKAKSPPAAPDKPKSASTGTSKSSTTAGPAGMQDDSQKQDPPKKPGLFARIFGKKPTPPANTNTQQNTATTSPPPVAVPSAPMPPAVLPTPGSFPPAGSVGTGEPPRVMPVQPVAPPSATPLFPTPTSVPVPSATPVPSTPIPTVPASPTSPPPMIPGLPSIPIPPPGDHEARDSGSDVIQTQYVTPETAAMMKEIQPYVTAMRTAKAPSERIFALRALANGRHGSTDSVKNLIFRSCVADPCPLVRACCIDELCRLGYYDRAFLAHLEQASTDHNEDVQQAARDAMKKMMPDR